MSWPWAGRATRRSARYSQGFRDLRCTLHNWLKRAEVEEGLRPGLTDAERTELREVKKRNRLLEQENEVLRRAAAYLSQANLPGK
jgi:transposase